MILFFTCISLEALLEGGAFSQSLLVQGISFTGLRGIEWVNFGGGSAKNLCIG
jgi:hypothetical protein